MKKFLTIASILVLFLFTACSNEEAVAEKDQQQGTTDKTEKAAEIRSSNKKEYTFEEFWKLSEQKQQDYLKAYVNNKGYNDELALELLGYVNTKEYDLSRSFETVMDYVDTYMENEDVSTYLSTTASNEEDTVKEEEEEPLVYNAVKVKPEFFKQRIKAVKGQPFYDIDSDGHLSLWGISLGDTIGEVYKKLGEPDLIAPFSYDNVQFYYFLPGDAFSSTDDIEYYQLLFSMKKAENYLNEPMKLTEPITEFELLVKYKDEVSEPVIHSSGIPAHFIQTFEGKVYDTSEVEQISNLNYLVGDLFFVHHNQTLSMDGNHLEARVIDPEDTEDMDKVLEYSVPISISDATNMVDQY